MANFLTFEENQVLINDNLFPANSISLQLNANTVPVKDIYGNLLYYSPTGPIQGTVGLNFFLTGAIPSYLRLENQDETPVKIAFNRLLIPDCYLTNLSFSVKPFEPIPVRAEFVFYHGVKALSTSPLILNNQSTNIPANGIAYANNLFTSGLNTLNGVSSYILTENRSSYVENANDFVVTDFDYQFSVERVPILRVGDVFPLRVAMKEANGEFSITTNNIDGYLDIHGNTAEFSAVLRDNTNLNVNDTVNLTGIIIDQNYEISDDNYGLSKIKMTQAINRKRSIVTIPMEVSNPNIVVPPTVNPVNPIVIPGSTVITTTIVEKEQPKPEDPNVDPNPPPQTDTDVYYYYTILFDIRINRLVAPNVPIIYESLKSIPSFTSFVLIDNNNNQISNNAKFEVIREPNKINNLVDTTPDSPDLTEHILIDALGCSFRVNESFKNNFGSSALYNSTVLGVPFKDEVAFLFQFDATDSQSPKIITYTYENLKNFVDGTTVPIGGNGTVLKPYIFKDSVAFNQVG